MTAGREEYDLARYFYAPVARPGGGALPARGAARSRARPVLESVRAFAKSMRTMREHLEQARQLHDMHQRQAGSSMRSSSTATPWRRWPASSRACGRVARIPRPRALPGRLRRSDGFAALAADTRALKAELAEVSYSVHIRGSRVKVGRSRASPTEAREVQATFARFKRERVRDYRVSVGRLGRHEPRRGPDARAGRPAAIRTCSRSSTDHCARHAGYLDPTIATFDREVQFYLAYLEFIAPLRPPAWRSAIPACPRRVARRSAPSDAFDLALAEQARPRRRPVVCNDFHLDRPGADPRRHRPEPGRQDDVRAHVRPAALPRQPRAARCPARDAQLFLPDRIFTHFEREEDIDDLRGKLEDELVRIHASSSRRPPTASSS